MLTVRRVDVCRFGVKLSSKRLADNAGEPYIPRIWRDFFGSLAVESKTDQFRPEPMLPMSEECETSIEIAAAHADAISIVVEGGQRSDDDIELLWCDARRRYGLPQSVTIALEPRIGRQFVKVHLAVSIDDGCKNALLCAPRARDDRPRVDLIPRRQIAAEYAARTILAAPNELICDPLGRRVPLCCVHGSPGALAGIA